MKKLLLIFPLLSFYFYSLGSNPWEDKTKSTMNLQGMSNKITNAHIINLEYGRVFSSFVYINSDGEQLSNLQGSINNHLAVGWKMHFKTSKLYILSGLAYNKYGAKGSDQALGNYYDWDVNYLGIKLGVGYEFLKTKSNFNFPYISGNPGITFHVQASVASDFLINGTQTINNQVYNLKGVEQFDRPFIFAYGALGVNYYPVKELSLYLQYNAGKGFSVFSDSNDKEKLNYISHIISFGISINLPI